MRQRVLLDSVESVNSPSVGRGFCSSHSLSLNRFLKQDCWEGSVQPIFPILARFFPGALRVATAAALWLVYGFVLLLREVAILRFFVVQFKCRPFSGASVSPVAARKKRLFFVCGRLSHPIRGVGVLK